MLQSISFANYRGFRRQNLVLRPETVVVGRNNAGKSTVIEGLRLVGLVADRYQDLNYHAVPDWLDISKAHRGVRPDVRGLGMRWENLFHQYASPPALVTARFAAGASIDVHLGPEGAVHAVVHDTLGRPLSSKGHASRLELPFLDVLPQVAPVSIAEEVISSDYVRRNLSSYLAPQHFRNQLNVLYDDHFQSFRELVEETWPGVQVLELVGRGALPGSPLELIVRDGDFAAEIAWMGHGLQMWLQTMWFVARTAGYDTIVLDEPDVYMHPDLQRRLIRFLRGRYPQVIIATHSTEILAETRPENVLIVERLRPEARFATDLPAVQKVVEEIGSAQNLQLTRLWTARRLILVEGDDLSILRRLQDTISATASEALDAIPNMPIGGWSGWPYAIGSAMMLRNAVEADIATYCILDSDYHDAQAIAQRMAEAAEKNVRLHIWRRKEIENYLLAPRAIAAVVTERSQGAWRPTSDDIAQLIDRVADELRADTTDAIAQHIYNRDKAAGIAAANRAARDRVALAWRTQEGRWAIVSGKTLLSKVSAYSQGIHGGSFGPFAIVAAMEPSDIAPEVRTVIAALEESLAFQTQL